MSSVTILLLIILVAVLSLPFFVHKVEENLEIFLFVAGILAAIASSQLEWPLVEEALIEPIKITIAVLIAGIAFKLLRSPLRIAVKATISRIGIKLFAFCAITILGLASSVITAIVSALILVEVIDCMSLDRKDEIKLVVLACFAIGIGAVLTPIGEPLSTIVIAKLKGEPYNASFGFLFSEYWFFIIPGILLLGIAGAVIVGKGTPADGLRETREENFVDILVRAGKTYLFVMALVFLGTGFKPLIDTYVIRLPPSGLFWINTVSAVLDNATLAAAEVGPSMTRSQLDFALLSLLISGGMLVPGNIPNIIAAGKLRIKSKEWLTIGLPVGMASLVAVFALLQLTRA